MSNRLHPPRTSVSFRARRLPHVFPDVLVLGSGAAGLRAALEAAEGADVLVVAKRGLDDTNTALAQGGVASALGAGDAPEDHAADTLRAGQGICDEAVVRSVTREGPERIRELADWGARFDREGEGLALAREGGHGTARIARARGDATGEEIQKVLLERARNHPRIRFLENTFAVDLLPENGRAAGVLLLGRGGDLQIAAAGAVVLATGGAGRLFRETTNPPGAVGDGLSMAHRAGAMLRDLEFIQFHPTALYVAGAPRFLITEAVRGEGAQLRDREGRRFMPDFHELAELAPRDVVSRAIHQTIRATQANCVYLDLSHLPPEAVRARFPAVARHLADYGIDLATDRVPVRPAAHYLIGGVVTDLHGASSVESLYAAGECASTGLHGANRLGSNSLLEALVFGRRAGASAAAHAGKNRRTHLPLSVESTEPEGDRPAGEIHFKDLENSLQSLMWRAAGVEREEGGLVEALEKIAFWSGYVLHRRFRSFRGLSLQNMLHLGRLVVLGALRRRESRGVHYRTDFPESDDAWARENPADPFEEGL